MKIVHLQQDIPTTTLYYPEGSNWEDLRFPATASKLGVLDKPDFDYTNLGLLFPQNDATEIAYIIAQFPHSLKKHSTIMPHVHYIQDEAQTPLFKIDYRIYAPNSLVPGAFTTLTSDGVLFNYASGSLHQLALFPAIDMTLYVGLSPIMDIKLYRDDNVVSGDVLVKEFDIHYQKDSVGSGEEYAK